MLKPIKNSVIKRSDIEKFYECLNKFKEITDLANAKTKEISIHDIWRYLEKLFESTNKIKNDPIERQLSILQDIFEGDGASDTFFEQLNYLKEFAKSETSIEEYEPINDNFIDIYDNHEKVDGISFLCPDLDKRTGGINAGKICTIVGGPGSMKTTYATNICYEAIKQGKNVCFLSLEETPLDIYSKLLSRVSVDLQKKLSVQDITQHKLLEDEQKVLKEEVYPYFENLGGTFYLLGESDLGDFSQSSIEDKLKTIDELIKSKSPNKENDGKHGIDILVVDHLQMFKYVNSKIKDEFQLMNAYVSFFRRQSKNFLNQSREISVILLSQCNREGIAFAQKNDGLYLMCHIAEASEIERASSYIISTYTDACMQMSKQMKIGAIKLRGAALPMSTINTYADGEFYNVGEVPIQEIRSYDIYCVTKEPKQVLDFQASLDEMLIGSF